MNYINNYWKVIGEEIKTYQFEEADYPGINEANALFLKKVGFPKSCAPGLSFNDFNKHFLPTPNQIFGIDVIELENYIAIGNNGAGDPICIDISNANEIVYLNHDNDFERIFINSSCKQLAESIILFRNFNLSLDPHFDQNQFVIRRFLDEEISQLESDFIELDGKCMEANSWWQDQLDYLLWERDSS